MADNILKDIVQAAAVVLDDFGSCYWYNLLAHESSHVGTAVICSVCVDTDFSMTFLSSYAFLCLPGRCISWLGCW